MKLNRIMFLMVLALAVCASGSGQTADEPEATGSISGTVRDIKTKEPIAYANVIIVGTSLGAMTLQDGKYEIKGVPAGRHSVKAMMMGYKAGEKHRVKVRKNKETKVMFELKRTIVLKTLEIVVVGEKPVTEVTRSDVQALATGCMKKGDKLHVRGGRSGEVQHPIYDMNGVPVKESPGPSKYSRRKTGRPPRRTSAVLRNSGRSYCVQRPNMVRIPRQPRNTEEYGRITENDFHIAIDDPFSTFSIDVDAASYSNIRRFLRAGQLPPANAVRIEELVNYFTYDYPGPCGGQPFSIVTEVSGCPWNDTNKLVHIGLQGKHIDVLEAPPCNLVFLLDVSGSMSPPNKLPLLQKAFVTLTQNLRREDQVAIVVYAGHAVVKLLPTSGDNKERIIEAIDNLYACGSTAGGAGLELAYDIAAGHFIRGGNNRIILATDGDFNTGAFSDEAMVQLIERKRKIGIFLTVLGFGEANLKDAKLEKIADHGNGHYAYIDDIFEARKVLVNEMGATLFTIAKDVKIQVEFNPAKVRSYRLLGYENRMLAKKDFEDDKKDAGEIGAGHSVTALYEIEPVAAVEAARVTQLNSYTLVSVISSAFDTPELLTVRCRYKAPDEDDSKLIERTVEDGDEHFENASVDFRFAAAVAEFGMLLRNSQYRGDASFEHVLHAAKNSIGKDRCGYRHEFVRLVEMCKEITQDGRD
jgi:Ca-activated chloride channel family protein